MDRMNPDDVPAPLGNYSHVIRHGAGTRIVISGQVGVAPDGAILDGLEAQMRQESAEKRAEYEERMQELRAERDRAAAELRRQREEGEQDWEDRRAEAQRAWEDVKEGFRRAWDRLS